MQSRKTILCIILVNMLVFGICFLVGGCSKSKNENSITVAIVVSLTGDLAANGKDTANGAKMAFEEANQKNVLEGYKIHYEVYDDQADPKIAVNIANQICQNKKIVAVVGHLTSGCMSAAAPIYSRENMPVVMPVPTNPAITQMGVKNLFRIPPTDNDQAPFLAKFLLLKDPTAPVAVVNDLTAYGVGFATAFRDTFVQGGGSVVTFEGVQKKNRDFRTLITKLKEIKPKYVVLGATYDMGAPFARQIKELGFEVTMLSGDGCYGNAFLDQAGNAAEGTIVSFIAPDRNTSSKTKHFFTEYEQKYGKVVSFAPLGYDAGRVVVEALSRAKSRTRQDIILAIHDKNFYVDGVTGKIQFDEKGDNKNKNLVLYIVKEGKWVLLK